MTLEAKATAYQVRMRVMAPAMICISTPTVQPSMIIVVQRMCGFSCLDGLQRRRNAGYDKIVEVGAVDGGKRDLTTSKLGQPVFGPQRDGAGQLGLDPAPTKPPAIFGTPAANVIVVFRRGVWTPTGAGVTDVTPIKSRL